MDKSIISLPLALGLDLENTQELVDNSRFLVLQNIVFDKTDLGQLHKRPGYTAINQSVISGALTTIGQATQLSRFNNELEALGNGSNLFSYSSSQSAWIQRGYIPQFGTTENQIAASAFSVLNPDLGNITNAASSISVYAYELNGCSYLKVIDEANQATIQQVQLTTPLGNTYSPKVVVAGSDIYVLASDIGGNLYVWIINSATPGAAPVQEPLITNGLYVLPNNETIYDAIYTNGYLCIAGGAATTNFDAWTFTGVSLTYHITNIGPYGSLPNCVNLNVSNSNLTIAFQSENTGSVAILQYSIPSLTPSGATIVFGGFLSAFYRITSVPFVLASNSYLGVFFETPGDSTQLPIINYGLANISNSTALGTNTWSYSLELASQPFINNGYINILCSYPSSVQQTLFLMSMPLKLTFNQENVLVSGKFWAGNGGQAPTNGRLPGFNQTNSGEFIVSVTNQTADISVNNTLETVYGVSELILNFNSNICTPAQLGLNLHIPTGGLTWNYDGLNLTEHNFNLFPEAVTTSFNTSQLAIINDVYDSACTTINGAQYSGRIAIPDNGTTPGGPIGNLITPGEYITFNAFGFETGTATTTINPVFVYFVVNGSGSAPSGSTYNGATFVTCNITSGMNAIEVATSLYNALNTCSEITAQYLITYTPNTQGTAWTNQYITIQGLAFYNTTPVSLSPPSLNRVCVATQINNGLVLDGGSTISAIPASLISSGQYVVLNVPVASITYSQEYALIYIWFSNPNIITYNGPGNQNITSGDPDPFGIGFNGVTGNINGVNCHYSPIGGSTGNFIGVEIVLNGNETEAQVAVKITNALNSINANITSGSPFHINCDQVTTVGATSCVLNTVTTNTQTIINSWTNNPNYVGMGQGYVGQNVTNTQGYAVINYTGVYEWVDNQNELHQSTPGVFTSVYIPVSAVTGDIPNNGNSIATLGTGNSELTFTASSSVYGTTLADSEVVIVNNQSPFTPDSCTIDSSSNNVILPTSTINVDCSNIDTFPISGTLGIITSTGAVTYVTYTGLNQSSPPQFTGCSGGSGTLSTGSQVSLKSPYIAGEVGVGSNGQVLGGVGFTIDIVTGFYYPSAGQISVVPNFAPPTIVSYTGTTVVNGVTTAFTGCSGGTGTLATNGLITLVTSGQGPYVVSDAYNNTVIVLNTAAQGLNVANDVVLAVSEYYTQSQITAVAGGNGTGLVSTGTAKFTGGTILAPITAIQSSIPCSASISVDIFPLNLTQKNGIDIALYRTITNQPANAFRLTPPATSLLENVFSAYQIKYNDYSADIDNAGLTNGIDSNELLYTAGGVIDNSSPPGFSFIINHQNRLFGVSAENPQLIYYTQNFESGYEVAFNTNQTITLNPSVANIIGGPITALASMDAYLVVFQENQIWYITGDGPGATGPSNQYNFDIPKLIASSSSIGCRDPNSVTLSPDGLIFKSNNGYYLLDRGLGLNYIGAPVKTYNNDVVSSTQSLQNNTQIIFLSEAGTTLIYDSYYKQWGTFTNHQGVASILDPNGVYNYINNTGLICTQTPNKYVDADGLGYPMQVQTAWIKLGNVQAYQRVWTVFFEGSFIGTQPYQLQVNYNYQDGNTQTLTYNTNAGTSPVSVWGNSPVWGDYIWGEDGTPISYPNSIQFRLKPNKQKCESIQFTFTDLAPYPAFSTCSLNAIDLEIAVKKGGFKIGIGNQIG